MFEYFDINLNEWIIIKGINGMQYYSLKFRPLPNLDRSKMQYPALDYTYVEVNEEEQKFMSHPQLFDQNQRLELDFHSENYI